MWRSIGVLDDINQLTYLLTYLLTFTDLLADLEDRELRTYVEGDAGVHAQRLRRLDRRRHQTGQGRSHVTENARPKNMQLRLNPWTKKAPTWEFSCNLAVQSWNVQSTVRSGPYLSGPAVSTPAGHVTGQGRPVRLPAGVSHARVHHTTVVRPDAGRRTARQQGIRHRNTARSA